MRQFQDTQAQRATRPIWPGLVFPLWDIQLERIMAVATIRARLIPLVLARIAVIINDKSLRAIPFGILLDKLGLILVLGSMLTQELIHALFKVHIFKKINCSLYN